MGTVFYSTLCKAYRRSSGTPLRCCIHHNTQAVKGDFAAGWYHNHTPFPARHCRAFISKRNNVPHYFSVPILPLAGKATWYYAFDCNGDYTVNPRIAVIIQLDSTCLGFYKDCLSVNCYRVKLVIHIGVLIIINHYNCSSTLPCLIYFRFIIDALYYLYPGISYLAKLVLSLRNLLNLAIQHPALYTLEIF